MGAVMIYSDRWKDKRTDMTKLTDAIRNHANATYKGKTRRQEKFPERVDDEIHAQLCY
jgi:hypothetical protein